MVKHGRHTTTCFSILSMVFVPLLPSSKITFLFFCYESTRFQHFHFSFDDRCVTCLDILIMQICLIFSFHELSHTDITNEPSFFSTVCYLALFAIIRKITLLNDIHIEMPLYLLYFSEDWFLPEAR